VKEAVDAATAKEAAK
jgi:hypothetical protein